MREALRLASVALTALALVACASPVRRQPTAARGTRQSARHPLPAGKSFPRRPEDTGLLYSTFQDHAVLQRGEPIPVWGRTKAGAEVTVTLANETVTARANASGHWSGSLGALAAGGPYTLTATSSGGTRQTAHDILVGDVFLCSGQSNMEYPTRLASDYGQDVNDANNARIRLFHIERFPSASPRERFGAGAHWEVTSPRSVREFSAVCYFFGRDLQPAVGVPIGLIESSWGGSLIQAWIGPRRMRRIGGYDRYLDLLPLYERSPGRGVEALECDRRALVARSRSCERRHFALVRAGI